jgi:cell division protein FtsB
VENDPLQPIIITNRRRRRRPKRRLRVGPWLMRAGLAALALGVSGFLLSRAFQPYTMRYRQVRQTRILLRELAEAKEQNRELQRKIGMLRSGEGLETEARKLGYIRKGEIPLQITFEAPSAKGE